MIRKNIKNSSRSFNYIFLFYDVSEKRVNKIFKICKKYLIHYQNSVFRGEITYGNLNKLKEELKTIVNKEEDFISILKLHEQYEVVEEIIGTSKCDCENIFV